MKRFLAVLLASTTLLSTSVFAGDMRYVCNNDEAEVTADAIFKDGIVYLPVAQVCKALGYKVIEKESNNSVTAEVKTKPGYFSVFLGKSKGRMNGQDIRLAKAPFKENDVIYVTAGLIEDQLGVSVKYDSSKNTIYIDSNGEGKITSTVGQVPAAKSTTTSSASSSSGSSSATSNTGAKYSGTTVPTFDSVTGISASSNTNGVARYNAPNAGAADTYCNYLLSHGFSAVKDSNGYLKYFSDGSCYVSYDVMSFGGGLTSSSYFGYSSKSSSGTEITIYYGVLK